MFVLFSSKYSITFDLPIRYVWIGNRGTYSYERKERKVRPGQGGWWLKTNSWVASKRKGRLHSFCLKKPPENFLQNHEFHVSKGPSKNVSLAKGKSEKVTKCDIGGEGSRQRVMSHLLKNCHQRSNQYWL